VDEPTHKQLFRRRVSESGDISRNQKQKLNAEATENNTEAAEIGDQNVL